MNKNKIVGLIGVASLAAAAVVGTVTAIAHAATVTGNQLAVCTVQYIAYANDELILKCVEPHINPAKVSTTAEINAWGPSFTGCSTHASADTLKAFTSLAEGAFLSGKKLTINFSDDTSCPTSDGGNTSIAYLKVF